MFFYKLHHSNHYFFTWGLVCYNPSSTDHFLNLPTCGWKIKMMRQTADKLPACPLVAGAQSVIGQWKESAVKFAFDREVSWCESLVVAPNENPCRSPASGTAAGQFHFHWNSIHVDHLKDESNWKLISDSGRPLCLRQYLSCEFCLMFQRAQQGGVVRVGEDVALRVLFVSFAPPGRCRLTEHA